MNEARITLILALVLICRVASADPAADYQQHCASCHGPDRFGAMGPALLPESLERLKKPDAVKVIAAGRPATQMQGFADKLSTAAIDREYRMRVGPIRLRRHTATERVVFSPYVKKCAANFCGYPRIAAARNH